MITALYHFHVGQIRRSAGSSAVAAAAYRAGEKLHSERYDEVNDYTKKDGVLFHDILLPPHAPPEYADRETLWNAVEKVEKRRMHSWPILSISLCRVNSALRKIWSWQKSFSWITSYRGA